MVLFDFCFFTIFYNIYIYITQMRMMDDGISLWLGSVFVHVDGKWVDTQKISSKI